MTRPLVRVLVVDDQALMREGLCALLALDPELVVVGAVGDGQAAVAAAGELQPDVVLMDLQMPVLDGIAATRLIVAAYSGIRVLALTTFANDHNIAGALGAGASGYLLKNLPSEELAAAIKQVAAGTPVLDPAVTERLIARVGALAIPAAALSPREREVLALLGQGLSNKRIAAALDLGEGTVKTHVHNLLHKLDLPDRVALALYAARAARDAP